MPLDLAPGTKKPVSRDTHKPEAIPPSLTLLVFERFLPSLTLWLSPNCVRVELRVLLPLSEIPANQYDWLSQRAEELNKFDPGSGDALNGQIDANAATIAARQPHGDIQLRRYNVPHMGRVIVTDRYVYFTPYQADSHGKNSPVYQFRRGGPFYENLRRFIAVSYTHLTLTTTPYV